MCCSTDLNNPLFSDFLLQWANKKADLKTKKISKDDYIEWKINYGTHKED